MAQIHNIVLHVGSYYFCCAFKLPSLSTSSKFCKYLQNCSTYRNTQLLDDN
jgi:hypothetical protein